MKKILVTGANSLLGTNIVLELLARAQYEVRVIVRHTNAVLEDPRVELVRANVADVGELEKAASGCDAVVHVAAVTAQDLLHVEDYRFNWECVEKIVEVARRVSIERIILVSSANTIGNGTASEPSEEDTPLESPYADSLYAQSKIRAEQALLRGFENSVIINPTFMIGAWDAKPSSGQIIMMGYGRRVIFAPSGGKNFVSVGAVAGAVCQALERGRPGQRYLAAGVNLSTRDFFRRLCALTRKRSLIVTVPSFLLIGAGYVGDALRWLGVHTSVSSVNMKILCQMEYYSNIKAHGELKMKDTDIDESILQAVEWFKENKMLK